MNRDELIKEVKKYFKLEELVCKHVFTKYREEQIWMFFSTQILETLVVLRRDIINKPFVINNWKNGGSYSQRGLRCNCCQLVKEKTMLEKVYISAHCTGNAFDVTVIGMKAEDARKLIEMNKHKLPYPIRIEKDVTWLHFDTYDTGAWDKITYFKG